MEAGTEDRYSRLQQIPWWDQAKLAQANVMVVGAGALGNELVKNLAMLGVGHIFLVDMDSIENSNLSRSVLFRANDEGCSKSEIAAQRGMELNPDVVIRPWNKNVLTGVGLGVFRRMHVVLGGLDNREARLGVNQACWKVTCPWIDGGIEATHGIVRLFVPPDGVCYECTMGVADFRLLRQRRSCALLRREEMTTGKVPTTPTMASIIAGIQVQEALKLLHSEAGLPVLAGKGFIFNGMTHDSYTVEYTRREGCLSHYVFDRVSETGLKASQATGLSLLALARDKLGSKAVIDLGREIVEVFTCSCGWQRKVFMPLSETSYADTLCGLCGQSCNFRSFHTIDGSEDFACQTLQELGVPPLDILTGCDGQSEVYLELSGDQYEVLGSDWLQERGRPL